SYLFTWESPLLGGAFGSCHALEVPFVFGGLSRPEVIPYVGSGPAVEALSDAMQQAWVAFARGGDPSCAALGVWPRYEDQRRSTMVLGKASAVEDDPRGEERRAWSDAGLKP